MKPLTLAESHAARIVSAISNCLCEQLDPGGGPVRLPDFELRNYRQERLGVLEVTSTFVADIAAFQSAQAKYKISYERLGFDWFIVTRGADASVKALKEQLPSLLVLAETKGFVPRLPKELLPGFNFVDGEEPQTSLSKEGVWILSALPAPPGRPGMVFVKPPAQGGAIGLEMVTTAVEAELNRADNLAKLATASAGERCELFVWLDEGTAGMALVTPTILPQFSSSYPTDGPILPEPVTCVWAATGPSDRDVLARALWVAEGGKWHVLTPPVRLVRP